MKPGGKKRGRKPKHPAERMLAWALIEMERWPPPTKVSHVVRRLNKRWVKEQGRALSCSRLRNIHIEEEQRIRRHPEYRALAERMLILVLKDRQNKFADTLRQLDDLMRKLDAERARGFLAMPSVHLRAKE